MGDGKTMIVAGIGFSSGVAPDDILRLLRAAQTQAGCTAQALAAPDFKTETQMLRAIAATLGLPLIFVSRPAMAEVQPRCQTLSEVAASATGLGSIAEACALAAAGPASRLLLPRQTLNKASCALAGVLP
jgi:cobalt-precorrin 5A hydrolase